MLVPKYGKGGFSQQEDLYLMNPYGNIMDTIEPQEVIIRCPHKHKRVSGVMNAGIRINGKAQWKNMFDGGVTSLAGKTIDQVSNIAQWSQSVSLQQPWMNRKIYNKTEPFSLEIPMSFVCQQGDAKAEVYDPVMALLSFIYPRQYPSSTNSEPVTGLTLAKGLFSKIKEKITGSKLGQNVKEEFSGVSLDGFDQSLVGSLLNAVGAYVVPGPGLKYDSTNKYNINESGDYVEVTIGNIFNLGACYLEDINIEFSQAMNAFGYPLAAKVTVKATSMNTCYCNVNGELQIWDSFGDTGEKIGKLLDSIQATKGAAINMFTTGMSNIFGQIGFFKDAVSK